MKKDTKQADAPCSTALNLAAAQDLKIVNLDNIIPESLCLPMGCDLHGRVCRVAKARAPVWLQNSAMLRSFVLNTRSQDDQGIDNNKQVPSVFTAPIALDYLLIDVCSFGALKDPIRLCGALARTIVNSKVINIDCREMHVQVAQEGMTCTSLRWISESMLSISNPGGPGVIFYRSLSLPNPAAHVPVH